MKPLNKIIFLLVIIGNLTSCIHVDIARWVINPSADGILRDHGYGHRENTLPLINRPAGSSLEETRLVSEDKIADISVTHLRVPEQKIGLVFCGGNGFRQSKLAKPIFNAFNPIYYLITPAMGFPAVRRRLMNLIWPPNSWYSISSNGINKTILKKYSFGGNLLAALFAQGLPGNTAKKAL